MSALPIVDDVLDRILNCLPDFKSLSACILAAPAFYKVYARRPKSICHQVASNIVGPVDAALDVIRFPSTHEEPRLSYFNTQDFPVQMFLDVPIIAENHSLQTLSQSDAQEFESLGKLADEWEDDFCLRWKDRRTNACLTPLESFRFRRAVYRLVFFHKAYEYVGVGEVLGIDVDLPPPSEVRQMFQVRVNFLDQLPSEELHQMQVVATYMTQIRAENGNENVASPDEQLSYGPSELYRSLAMGYDLPPRFNVIFETDLTKQYFFVPLEAALGKRGAKLLPNDVELWDHILDERLTYYAPCNVYSRFTPDASEGTIQRCPLWPGRALVGPVQLGSLHKAPTINRLCP